MSSLLRKLQKRNYFDLSEQNALSCRMGKLIPFYVNHLVPGDTFDMNAFINARFAPMQAPIMSHVDIKTWGFAVPYRLVWDDAYDFFKGKNKRGDEVDPTFPRVNWSAMRSDDGSVDQKLYFQLKSNGELSDYLDLSNHNYNPTGQTTETMQQFFANCPDESVLEPRAYQMIFNEWFRDQNIDEPVDFRTDSIVYDPRTTADTRELRNLYQLREKRWAKDYFTSALPTPSLAPDVEIPISSDISYKYNLTGTEIRSTTSFPVATDVVVQGSSLQAGGTRLIVDNSKNLNFDNKTTIRELTYSKAVYKYFLDAARGGSVRMTDWVKTMFGVRLPDYRAEIPEYIGGGSQPVIVSEVVQTSETSDTPQGTMTGRAVSVGKGHSFYYKATEPCIVMLIACVIPKPSYSQGLPKRHTKFDRFDYYLPQFDHIGDQEIKKKELFLNEENNEETFGYAPRFAEYKSSVDRVHGEFRDSLAHWTMARSFLGTPSLSPEFITPDNSLLDRPFFVQSTISNPYVEQVYLEINTKVDAWRPMSKKSIPIV